MATQTDETCLFIQSLCHHGIISAATRVDMGQATFTFGLATSADAPQYHTVNGIWTKKDPLPNDNCSDSV